MPNRIKLTALLLSCALVAGCGPADTQGTTAVEAPAHEIRMTAESKDVLSEPKAGALDGDRLVSNGGEGYLMFGPYASLSAGSYVLTVHGDITQLTPGSAAKFDVVSSKGTLTHGSMEVSETTGTDGTLTSFPVTVDQNVSDLEIRAWVPAGAELQVRSYELLQATATR
ncbi:hypothetical protein LU699_11965 [Luteimonas fraxinea]|uniref:Uncharacterized protein n=1 Tax=Luteimonas fraxinea TaxID=2901869 RepID=A0ABS8UHY5_9GAMM|nr:hypothetical protein [Luteimonas fraxinea]MCD9098587.1 hypothetical protein [Luteimonas fraxinea]MCD9127320.1 hypothetical protein [Luteimonas fraxinea]UHH09010.1 hypothetical protein LU699_11965 [Luteimonas fraxinea]